MMLLDTNVLLYAAESGSQYRGWARETIAREYVDAPCEFVEVPGVGHFVTDEAPGVFPPLLQVHLERGR